MCPIRATALAALLSVVPLSARAGESQPASTEPSNEAPPPVVYHPNGDLFPRPGRLSASAATGLPFVGIAEIGMGITNGIAVGVIGGVTPSVLTAGIRPRFRVRTSEHTALMLNMPMLWYPKASAPGPGNIQDAAWLLTRPELFVDVTATERLHVAGGMGIIAAASTVALKNELEGKEFAVPAYSGSTETKKGFAGGIWNTVCMHSSYAIGERTHLFAEGSIVMSGLALAENVGGPPLVVTVGMQHTFW